MKIKKLIKELKKLEERHGDKKVTFVWHHEPTGATEYYHIKNPTASQIIDDQKLNAEHMELTDDIEIYLMEE